MDYNLHYYTAQSSGYPPPPPPPQHQQQLSMPMMQQQQGHHIPVSSPLPIHQQHINHHQHQQRHHVQQQQQQHLHHNQQQHHHSQQVNYNHQHSASPHLDLQPSPRPSTGFSPHPHMHQQSPHQMAPGSSPIHQQSVVGTPASVPPPSHTPQQLMPTRILTPQPLAVQVTSPQMQPQMQTQMHHQNFVTLRKTVPQPSQPNYHISPAPHHQLHSPQLEPHHNHHPMHQPQQLTTQQQQPSPNYMLNHPNNIHTHHPQTYDRGPVYYQNISQTELRIIELNNRLQNRPRYHGPVSPLPETRSSEENYWWERFAFDFFDADAKLTLQITPDDKPVEYSIGRILIPRFFKSYFDGGVIDLAIKVRNSREIMTPKSILFECDQTDITSKYNFKHSATNMPINVVVHTEGFLNLEFKADSLLIKSWKFYTQQCHEYIDRSMTASVAPSAFLVEPVTKHGLTTSTMSYLKMCMIMEPMQELMFQHRQTQKSPRSCLKQLLFDKYKLTTNEDKPPVNKRRKRKAPANVPANGGGGGNKKTKATAAANASLNINNNHIINNNSNSVATNNNICYNNSNNNGITSPSLVGQQKANLPLSQDTVTSDESMQTSKVFNEEEKNCSVVSNLFDDKIDQTIPTNDKIDYCNDKLNQDNQIVIEAINKETNSNGPPEVEQSQLDNSVERIPQVRGTTNDIIDSNSDYYKNENVESILKKESSDRDNLTPQINNTNHQVNSKSEFNHLSDHLEVNVATKSSQQETMVLEKQPKSIEANGDSVKANPVVMVEEQKKTIEETKKIKEEFRKTNETKRPKDETLEKENNSSLNDELKVNTTVDTKSNSCDSVISKPSPSSNSKTALTTIKQNRRRSSERKETLREGLMRTSDFVVAMKDLKCEHPALWRITTGNNLLQQFEPKTKDGIVLYENTNQYAGWNPEIKKDYVGVDVKLTQHTRNQITVEKLLLNFQKIEDADTFYDKHFVIYLQIIISTALDPKFWECIEKEPEHHDYFITSRKIIEDITKQYKLKLSNKLQLSGITLKNVEKYPNLLLKQVIKNETDKLCRACNIHLSTQILSFEDRSYDLHSFKPVKVSSESTKSEENNLCDVCSEIVRLYSQIHHLGWKLYNLCKDKIDQLRTKSKPINLILDDCLKDEDWLTMIYSERDTLWSKVQQIN